MTKEDLNKKRGCRLRECRTDKNLTQKQLADLCYCTTQTISYIENGKRGMSRELAHTFSMQLGIDEEYLLCETYFKTFREKNKYLDALNNECDSKLTDLLQLLGHKIKLLFNAGEFDDPEALIDQSANFHFDTYSNDIIMETENCSRRIHNIRIQFDDITISPITFMEFFSDIYDYIDFLIEHLTDKEEKNKYNFALYNMETAFKQEQEFESLSKEEKIRRIKKDFGSILLCDEETAENK